MDLQSSAEKQARKATHQCKAVATVAAEDVHRLTTLLEGLSGQAGLAVLIHVRLLKGPVKDKVAAQLRLTRCLASETTGMGVEAIDR